MGLFESAKEAFKIAQSLDNIELQTKILGLQEQALELVAENSGARSTGVIRVVKYSASA